MSQVSAAPPDPTSRSETKVSRRAADGFANAVLLMLLLTIVQRSAGFIRSVLVCRLLDPTDLGYWNMAKSFLILFAPLVVFGLPGALKRYVAYYRERGQLHAYVRRTNHLTLALTLIGASIVFAFPSKIGWVAFGDDQPTRLMTTIGGTLVLVIAFNYAIELLTALRRINMVSYLQLAHSVVFTVITIGLLLTTELKSEAVIVSYGIASAIVAAIASYDIRLTLRDTDRLAKLDEAAQVSQRRALNGSMWNKVLPFAGGLWIADLLTNLFGNVDRLMIVHMAGDHGFDAMAMIGQYHSSQIIGFLLISLTGMLGSVLLSYLSHDWETGQQDRAKHLMDFSLKLVSLALTAAAACALLAAPLIYSVVLQGKFVEGYNVLPVTMAYCIWFGLVSIAHNYLWCRERAILVSLSVMAGLIINAGLNFWWLPLWGLNGAVASTAVANVVTLGIVIWMCHQLGLRYRWGTLVACMMPATLCLGGIGALASLTIVLLLGLQGQWLFSQSEKQRLHRLLNDKLFKYLPLRFTHPSPKT